MTKNEVAIMAKPNDKSVAERFTTAAAVAGNKPTHAECPQWPVPEPERFTATMAAFSLGTQPVQTPLAAKSGCGRAAD
jgi:hypothetical protein